MVDYETLRHRQEQRMQSPGSSFIKHAAGQGAQPKLYGKGDSYRHRSIVKVRKTYRKTVGILVDPEASPGKIKRLRRDIRKFKDAS